MFTIKKAARNQVKLKLGLSGTSGSGKTMSALLLAKGLVGDLSRVCLIDTENSSASLYSQLGDFSILDFKPPFHPEKYVKAIQEVVKTGLFDCLIIDSVSHEWDGSGGCLEIQEQLGGRFQDWAKVTPMHREFIDAILQAPIHVITTARRKQDYSLEKGENGKTTPKKVGLKEVQREGFEYELTVNFDVEINHRALASKDRTGIFSTKVPFIINEEIGVAIKLWNESGKMQDPVVATPQRPVSTQSQAAPKPPASTPKINITSPGDYVIKIGKNKDKSLNEAGLGPVKSLKKFLEDSAEKDKKPLTGNALEFVAAATLFINMQTQPTATALENEEFPK